MTIFKDLPNEQAFLKMGLMGFAGSGKTYTAAITAAGLVQHMRERNLDHCNDPVMFLDTETGSDFVKPILGRQGIELYAAKTRAFADLVPAVREAEASASVLIIDSITHFWRELCDTYIEKRGRTGGLQFHDWQYLKKEWGKFTDLMLNSNLHVIMCGRAGFEYDFFVDEDNKKQLEKTGIKMKAESETGYEPSLLVLMERHMDMEAKKSYHTAIVLKDRSTLIQGEVFRNPTFESFRPHVEFLNLGGEQMGIDQYRTSHELIDPQPRSLFDRERAQRQKLLDLIQALLVKHFPKSTGQDKEAKQNLIVKHFETRQWSMVELYEVSRLIIGLRSLRAELEGTESMEEEIDRQAAEIDQLMNNTEEEQND